MAHCNLTFLMFSGGFSGPADFLWTLQSTKINKTCPTACFHPAARPPYSVSTGDFLKSSLSYQSALLFHPPCSHLLSNICTNTEKETKVLVCIWEICFFSSTQTFFNYQCKWGRHDTQHQITLRLASCSRDGWMDRGGESCDRWREISWFFIHLSRCMQLQEATRWLVFYPFRPCKSKSRDVWNVNEGEPQSGRHHMQKWPRVG